MTGLHIPAPSADGQTTEDALRDEIARLRFMLDHALTAIATLEPVLDADGHTIVDFRYVSVNAMVEQLDGRPASQIVGQQLLDLYPGTRENGLFAQWVELMNQNTPIHYIEHFLEDGAEAWYETRAVCRQGQLIVSYIDITPLRKAQQQAQQQANLLQSILDNTQAGLVLFAIIRNEANQAVDFQYVLSNPVNSRLLGMAESTLIGQMAYALFPALRESDWAHNAHHCADTGESRSLTFPLTQQGGSGWFDATFTRLDNNHLLLTYTDVTALKQAEAEQRQQAELIRSVLDGSPNGIIAFDAVRNEQGQLVDLRYVLQNEVNRRRVGRSDDELIGQTMLRYFPEVVELGIFDQYRHVIETGEAWRMETAFRYPHGTGWFNYSAVKRADGLVLTVQDKTAEHQARLQLEAANAALLKSNENLQSFAYVASHDLQEPMRKIQAFSDLMLTQYGMYLPPEGQDLLRRMQSAAQRMRGLIRDLLTLARLTTHPQAFSSVGLATLLKEVLSDLETLIAEKRAVIEVGSLPVVAGDKRQLGQLFQNLLSNALKFTRPDWRPIIQIRCERIPVQQIPPQNKPGGRVAANGQSGHYWVISVSDNGIGFDAQRYGERIFGAFQRLHGRNDTYAGTGIGLAIARKVVENHGGSIAVDSREGEGATFTIYLPIQPEANVASAR